MTEVIVTVGFLLIAFIFAAALAACSIEGAIKQFIDENYFLFGLELIIGLEFILMIVLFSIKLIF